MVLRGLLLIVPSFAIVGFAQNMPTLYLGLTLYALSTSVVVPCMTTLVSHYGNVSQKGIIQRSLLVPLNLFKNLMFFTFLCLNKSNISQKSQIGLAEMSPIAKSGNSMLMICFDLNKTELPDLAIREHFCESNSTFLGNI